MQAQINTLMQGKGFHDATDEALQDKVSDLVGTKVKFIESDSNASHAGMNHMNAEGKERFIDTHTEFWSTTEVC